MSTQPFLRGSKTESVLEVEPAAEGGSASRNRFPPKTLRRATALPQDRSRPGVVGASLDGLFGTWTTEEADEFDRAVADFDVIDESIWR